MIFLFKLYRRDRRESLSVQLARVLETVQLAIGQSWLALHLCPENLVIKRLKRSICEASTLHECSLPVNAISMGYPRAPYEEIQRERAPLGVS
jgi:hypothetical protein